MRAGLERSLIASSTCPDCTISPGRALTCVTTPLRGMLNGRRRPAMTVGADSRGKLGPVRVRGSLEPASNRCPQEGDARGIGNDDAVELYGRCGRHGASRLEPDTERFDFRRVDAHDNAMAVGRDANRCDHRFLALHLVLPFFLPLSIGEDQGPRQQREKGRAGEPADRFHGGLS